MNKNSYLLIKHYTRFLKDDKELIVFIVLTINNIVNFKRITSLSTSSILKDIFSNYT